MGVGFISRRENSVAAQTDTEKSDGHKPSFMVQAIGVVIATLMAAGAGGGSAYYLVRRAGAGNPVPGPAVVIQDSRARESAGKETAAKPAPLKDTPPPPACGEELTALPIPVVLTNLADPASVFVRLEADMIMDAKSARSTTALASEISGDFMAYLHSLSSASFEGPSSFLQLKEDLTDRAQTRSKGLVREIIIRGLVVK